MHFGIFLGCIFTLEPCSAPGWNWVLCRMASRPSSSRSFPGHLLCSIRSGGMEMKTLSICEMREAQLDQLVPEAVPAFPWRSVEPGQDHRRSRRLTP